jgi:hypothetical protein
MFEKLVDIVALMDIAAQCSPYAKSHSTHGDYLFHQPWQPACVTPWLKMQTPFHFSNIGNYWYFLLKGHVLLLLGDAYTTHPPDLINHGIIPNST